MDRYFSIFDHLNQRKFAQQHYKYTKVCSKIFQEQKKPSKMAKGFENFAKVLNFRQIWSH